MEEFLDDTFKNSIEDDLKKVLGKSFNLPPSSLSKMLKPVSEKNVNEYLSFKENLVRDANEKLQRRSLPLSLDEKIKLIKQTLTEGIAIRQLDGSMIFRPVVEDTVYRAQLQDWLMALLHKRVMQDEA